MVPALSRLRGSRCRGCIGAFHWNVRRELDVSLGVAERRSLGAAWLSGAPEAEPFLSSPSIEAATAARSIHPQALAAFRAEPCNFRPAAAEALRRLGSGAAAVVTGQQAGLLMGPLYTFHKASSSILVAQALERAGTPAVAVFWVQDEDHDFTEAARTAYRAADGGLVQIELPDEAPRTSLSARSIPPALPPALDGLAAALRGPYVEEARTLIGRWRSGGWVDAFVATLAQVFFDSPLLIVRGRALSPASAESVAHALERAAPIGEALVANAERIAAAGFRVQVPPRPDCALAFVHPEGRDGPRFRPRLSGGGFVWPGRPRPVPLSTLLSWLAEDPARFSTSALLRPLVQDRLLPTAAQLVGPGEASYLAQLGPLRAEFSAPAPVIAPRGAARYIDATIQRRLDALGLSAEQALSDAAPASLDPSLLRASLLDPLLSGLDQFGPLSPSLERARGRTAESVRRSVSRFVGKMVREAAEQDAVRARRLGEVRAALLPGGQPQERVLGLTGLVAEHGIERLKDRFREDFSPFSGKQRDIYL